MPDPIARKRPTAETFDVSAFPPMRQGGSLDVYAMENAAPGDPKDVAAFPHAMGGGPVADLGPGSSTTGALIIFDTGNFPTIGGGSFAPGNAYAQVTVQGPAAAEVGLLLFRDQASDSYHELRVLIGAGTSGEAYLRTMAAGMEFYPRISADDTCNGNQYDFPAATNLTLRLCQTSRVFQGDDCGDSIAPVLVGTITVGVNTYKIGDSTNYYGVSFKAGMSIATGSGVTFDDFSFWYAGLPDCTVVPDAQTCETCETCWLIVSSSALDLAKFTVVSGTWSIVGGNLRATTTGTILLGDAWINDNLRIGWAPTCGTYPFRARYLFSWVDDNNYWCIEWRNGIIGTHAVWARIIERVGGSETIHVDLPIGIIDAVDIWNCILWWEYRFGVTAWYGGCLEGPFNETGQVGFKVMEVTDYVEFGALTTSATCPTTRFASCDEVINDPNDDPPDDPTGCCTDLETISIGDTIEATISGITYFFGAPCAGICGDSDFLAALNATHPVTCVYKSAVYMAFTADLGIIDTGTNGPCDPYTPATALETMKLWVWVTNIGGGECLWRAALYPSKTSVCLMYFVGPTVTPIPATCSGLSLTRDTTLETSLSLDARACCRQGGQIDISIP